jgi:hypothetical protein
MSVGANNGTSLQVAAVQMDANPAPTIERLKRAERLVTGAAESGAELVVLPECFNTGYAFSEENHTRVERIDGLTATWLRETAARLNIHLGGSLMMLEQGDTYNSLLLFAPDGRMWRYDKNCPWGWEQGYFRPSQLDPRITIAETDLGDIGMLICWDVSHSELWQMYAGRVDLMIISSCPVEVGHAIYQLPGGNQFTLEDMGSRFTSNADTVLLAFGDMLNQQTAWLGVPAVHSTECGHIQTPIPMGRRSLLGYIFAAPWMVKYMPRANKLQMSCDLVQECKILDNSGEILTRLSKEDGETFIMAEVKLPPSKISPQNPQPASLIPGTSYFLADVFIPAIMKPVYRRGQRQWKSA